MYKYQVIVGNIGTIYDGDDRNAALLIFNDYSLASRNNYGRAAGETVHLFENDEIIRAYEPIESMEA